MRPLLDDEEADPASVTRDYALELDQHPAPLLNVFGGKITTYRKLAESAVDILARQHRLTGACLDGARAAPRRRPAARRLRRIPAQPGARSSVASRHAEIPVCARVWHSHHAHPRRRPFGGRSRRGVAAAALRAGSRLSLPRGDGADRGRHSLAADAPGATCWARPRAAASRSGWRAALARLQVRSIAPCRMIETHALAPPRPALAAGSF